MTEKYACLYSVPNDTGRTAFREFAYQQLFGTIITHHAREVWSVKFTETVFRKSAYYVDYNVTAEVSIED